MATDFRRSDGPTPGGNPSADPNRATARDGRDGCRNFTARHDRLASSEGAVNETSQRIPIAIAKYVSYKGAILTWPLEPLPPRPQFEDVWRLVGPSGRVVVCRIAVIPRTVIREVRIVDEDDPDALIRTQMTYSIGEAFVLAEEWKAAILAKGSFTEVS